MYGQADSWLLGTGSQYTFYFTIWRCVHMSHSLHRALDSHGDGARTDRFGLTNTTQTTHITT